MSVGAVIPVKPLGRALRRLSPVLDGAGRRALQEAMLADILMACRDCAALEGVVVVTSDPDARAIAHAHGARVVADHAPARGINAAVARGLAEVGGPALVLMADLALARPADLAFVIDEALPAPGATLVASRDGTGTNAMLLDPPDVLDPHLGPRSLGLHLDQAARMGVAVRVLERPALGLDVDTPQDLAAFWRIPSDGQARRVLSRLDTHRMPAVAE